MQSLKDPFQRQVGAEQMRSMTGFGRGEASSADGAVSFVTEIASVNRKQLEIGSPCRGNFPNSSP
jgi:hypothetical protein